MKNYKLTAVIEKDTDGYFAYCPELQGCYTQGDTYEEALSEVQSAIRFHVETFGAEVLEEAEVAEEVFTAETEVTVG